MTKTRRTQMKLKSRIAKGLWAIDTFLLVSYHPAKTGTGHKMVGVWKDMQNKMVGYTLAECVEVAKGRRARGEWPFPIKPKRRRSIRNPQSAIPNSP